MTKSNSIYSGPTTRDRIAAYLALATEVRIEVCAHRDVKITKAEARRLLGDDERGGFEAVFCEVCRTLHLASNDDDSDCQMRDVVRCHLCVEAA